MTDSIARPIHETESGSYPAAITAADRSSVSSNVDNSVNKALPWFGVSMVMSAIALAMASYALSVSHQAKVEAWNDTTHYLLLKEHTDQLRFELASHGIKPPPYPKELIK